MTEQSTLFSAPASKRPMRQRGFISNWLVPWLYATVVVGSLVAALPEGTGAGTVACLGVDLSLLAAFLYVGRRVGLWRAVCRPTPRAARWPARESQPRCEEAAS